MEGKSCIWYTRQGPEGPFGVAMDLVLMHSKVVAKNGDTYVLAAESHYPAAELRKSIKDIDGFCSTYGLTSRINVVVAGQEQAMEIANKVYEILQSPIGIVKYEDYHNILSLQVDSLKAIRIARKKKERIHLYDPSTESLDAIIEKARRM
jgi:hypothetical protein